MSIFLPRQRKGKNWQESFLKREESQLSFFFIFAG